ncbi:hypothetical protein [Xylophilus sp. GOD-11R]|uniref:hypothetical protein n=1 Tax=Xylophilus sp. GOD-11R TaxID=3089814 RepID=UPI00298C3F2C|nr:hypothetical protein [Xylophilus sp. GOD-11R]WPB55971.1 hypothetical protein R9X41_17730 [Xylophilus sp. GOD-11R]
METRLIPPPVERGMIPQPVIVIGALLLCLLVYGFASGGGTGQHLDSDRLIIAECWKGIERRAPGPEQRRDMTEACQRMERGFRLKYGATL